MNLMLDNIIKILKEHIEENELVWLEDDPYSVGRIDGLKCAIELIEKLKS